MLRQAQQDSGVLYWDLCNCKLVIRSISWELGVGSAISMEIISDFKNFSNLCSKIDERYQLNYQSLITIH
jgi:hypothetical protein